MVRLSDILERRSEIIRIAARHGARNVTLFGSVARDRADETSDVDFLVELDADRSLLDRIALKHELEDLLGRPVDVINRNSLDPQVRDRILSDRVEL